ncbi:seizure protein 6 homolog isoform X2 [Seriola lalandi dorsalis]|uniref:Seizure related 6 homolog n=1 Tax=Seriola lalandi dorsalis TaxID=1841481 RepID=A0A3B4YH11_SERLL|nr:seizure protein 6 homolog isoform X2 [Seriola lalandi dorsalis]XP_023274119.1 seizure protein 6 homolog isoform X2 [Seriola lalandi dorsalis]XP_056252629.1 seizure protein 6 homolog isoform X2 [Seriola aureovittata]XP_056252630.1 seizure protein 6 homolog isoform X2 [Seriola aureovittata]
MCRRQDCPLKSLFTVLVLAAAAVTEMHGQGLKQSNSVSKRTLDSERDFFTHSPTQDTESEVHLVTTVSPMNIPNHRPVLKGLLLHEHLLTRDFQGDQHFFRRDGSVAAFPTMPGSVSASDAGDPATQLVPHEDAPAFSDIATTATLAATSPLTTFSPTTPRPSMSLPQKKSSKEKTGGADKVEPTTDTLTTQVTPNNRGFGSENNPAASSSSQRSHSPFPVGTTLAPSSVRMEKGEAPLKYKSNPDQALPTLTEVSRAEGATTMSTTVIMTTTITITQTSESCGLNFTDPEGNIEIQQQLDSGVECNYLVTVYLGYGIEVQVLNVSVLEGEQVTVEDTGGQEPLILANESVLVRGLVLRSWSNQISIRFRSDQQHNSGFLLLHYQAFVLSCVFPKEPAGGEVSVTHLHAGGEAYFRCFTGYKLQGPKMLTCRNATTPYWSGKEPQCVASCGGMIKNATYGRIVSPGFPGNYSNNLTCHWVLEVPEGHRLHIHFEKVALAEDDDRLMIKNGNNIDSPPVYDSYEVEYLPNEGVLSTGRYLFIEFTTDGTVTSTGAAIRYEAFAKGMCYEPFVKYGNFSSSDSTYSVGAVVEFSCDPGYTLEQGSVVIECVDAQNPQWNETEPACRAVCSGEITDSAGVVLSPNWPEAYDKGQDCIWGIHVEEDKRIMLDIQVLHVGKNDLLTFYDGDDLTANILGQYSGTRSRFKLYTSMADVTIQFQSDPATNIYGYNNGFVVHFFEVPRNDTCSELPEITNGWKSTSHPDLIHGTVITYQCYPGYELVGSEILMCQWDLSWSGDVPRCEEVMTCHDPGNVEHSRKVMTGSRFAVGSTVQFICNKGYILSGSGLLTCYNRDSATPKWSERLPKCVPEKYEPCRNPGAASTSVQSSEKAFYQAGETLTFSCHSGYELQGEATIYCVPGHPSQWNSTPPACRASSTQYVNERRLDVVNLDYGMEGTNIALAVFVPTAIILVVVLGIYVYFSKLQGKSIRMPTSSPPYDNMTEESAFDNPIYESGHWQTHSRY